MNKSVDILSMQYRLNISHMAELNEYNCQYHAKIDTNKIEIAKLEAENLDLAAALSKLKENV